jgi:hypothetical protein
MTANLQSLRQQIRDEAAWFKTTGGEAQKRWMKLAHLLCTARNSSAWKDWKKKDGKCFQTFDDYIETEVGVSKSKGYMMMDVVDHLKLPAPKLEELGKTRCYELARAAREKPKSFGRVLEKVRKNPEMTVGEVKTLVDAHIAGRSLHTERYARIEFVVKDDDMQTVEEALAVMQAQEPVDIPDSAFGRGVHLISIAQEYLSGEEETKILKELKKSGFFRKTPFQLEG